MLHSNFLGNRSTSSGEDLYRFTIYGCCDHLGHVTDIILIYFHFFVSKSLHTKYGKNGPVVSEKSKFNFLICKRPWT